MDNPNKQSSQSKSSATLHPGSSAADAAKIGGKGDFGVRESDVVERAYTSANTKLADPGGAPARSGEDGSRTSGAGGNNSGPGSSSGGDLDTDVVGLDGRGLATSGNVDEPAGPDDTDGTSAAFASGKPAQGRNQTGGVEIVKGSTVQPADDRTSGPYGADSAANSDPDNDASAGEISTSEASGADN